MKIERDGEKKKTLIGDLIESEGYRRDPYKDTAGKISVGS